MSQSHRIQQRITCKAQFDDVLKGLHEFMPVMVAGQQQSFRQEGEFAGDVLQIRFLKATPKLWKSWAPGNGGGNIWKHHL